MARNAHNAHYVRGRAATRVGRRRILGGLTTIRTGLAELRNRGYGTGRGTAGARIGLRARQAHLAVNAAFTWCLLMLDTLADPEAPWRRTTAN